MEVSRLEIAEALIAGEAPQATPIDLRAAILVALRTRNGGLW